MHVLNCSLHCLLCLLCSAFNTDPRLWDPKCGDFFNHSMKTSALSIKQNNGMPFCWLWLAVSKTCLDKLLLWGCFWWIRYCVSATWAVLNGHNLNENWWTQWPMQPFFQDHGFMIQCGLFLNVVLSSSVNDHLETHDVHRVLFWYPLHRRKDVRLFAKNWRRCLSSMQLQRHHGGKATLEQAQDFRIICPASSVILPFSISEKQKLWKILIKK